MRMSSPFQGTTATKQQFTANCIAAKRCLRHYFKLIWDHLRIIDHSGHKFLPSLNAPFRLKRESNGLQVDRNCEFSERIFQVLQYSRQHPSSSACRATLMTKTDLTFPAFSSRVVNCVLQFRFHCKFIPREATLGSSLTIETLNKDPRYIRNSGLGEQSVISL